MRGRLRGASRALGRLALVLACACAGAQAGQRTHEYTLDNGLRLIVEEDHRAPVVVSQVWYRVGSSYEHPGTTGVSHVLEHMMFKGTERHGPGEFSRIISEHGGRENAFTGRDYTAYFQQLERSRLEISFRLEADRMANLTLPEAEFDKEIEVVKEERRMRTEDDPQAYAFEVARATAWRVVPYRNPVIGWMADLERLGVADLRHWYERWYAPGNAIVVVVGDVDPEQVHGLARRHFGRVEPRPTPTPATIVEPPQHGPQRVTVRVPARVPYLIMDFKAPSLASAPRAGAEPWAPYALEVLRGLLGGDESARLPARLVRGSGVAAEIDAHYELYARLGSLLSIAAVPAADHGPGDVEAAVKGELAELAGAGPSAGELERVKTRLRAQKVYQQDSLFYRAMQIGILETVGLGWQRREEYVEGIESVTPAQVREVARTYLDAEGMTVTVLEPEQDASS